MLNWKLSRDTEKIYYSIFNIVSYIDILNMELSININHLGIFNNYSTTFITSSFDEYLQFVEEC